MTLTDRRAQEALFCDLCSALAEQGVLLTDATKPDVSLKMESEPSPEELQMFRADFNMALSKALMHRNGVEGLPAIRGHVAHQLLPPERAATIPEEYLQDSGSFLEAAVRAKFGQLEITPPVTTFDLSEWVLHQAEQADQSEPERQRLLAISVLPHQLVVTGEPGDDFLEHGVNSATAVLELIKRLG